jgi:hypothetical protein
MKIRDIAIVTFWTLLPLVCFAGIDPTPLPEPGTMSLVALGAIGIAAVSRKRRK